MNADSTDAALCIQRVRNSCVKRQPCLKEVSPASKSASLGILVVFAAIVIVIGCLLPRIPQPLTYHEFADRRTFHGIPNFGDVVSNLPFAVIGIYGIVFVFQCRSNRDACHFLELRETWPYLLAFTGLLMTAFGSSYYHLAPDNARLVWDRLPMTITFMSMVAAVITERIDLRVGLRLLPVLLIVGLMSVLQWYWSEMRGTGDLRFYAGVQVYSALAIVSALVMPARYTRSTDLALVAGFYTLAKALEFYDTSIFTGLHFVSGHTLKHLAAAAAGFCILRMLRKREALTFKPSTFNAGPKSAAVNSLCALMVRNDHD